VVDLERRKEASHTVEECQGIERVVTAGSSGGESDGERRCRALPNVRSSRLSRRNSCRHSSFRLAT
jgi:hypothetical protein